MCTIISNVTLNITKFNIHIGVRGNIQDTQYSMHELIFYINFLHLSSTLNLPVARKIVSLGRGVLHYNKVLC